MDQDQIDGCQDRREPGDSGQYQPENPKQELRIPGQEAAENFNQRPVNSGQGLENSGQYDPDNSSRGLENSNRNYPDNSSQEPENRGGYQQMNQYQETNYYSNGPYQANPYQQPPKQSGLALASLIMGILGIVTACCCYLGVLFGSLGIIFALLSKTEEKLAGYAKAGLITSCIAFGLSVLAVFFYIFIALMSSSGTPFMNAVACISFMGGGL